MNSVFCFVITDKVTFWTFVLEISFSTSRSVVLLNVFVMQLFVNECFVRAHTTPIQVFS